MKKQQKPSTSARDIHHETIRGNIVTPDDTTNENMINDIIDSRDTSETSGIDDIDSREDMLHGMKKDMVADKEHADNIFTIMEDQARYNNDDFNIEVVDSDDDAGSVSSDNGGCQFILTKGKNQGVACGRKRVDDTRCSRHANK
jgi:hypothetical protein